MATVPKRRIKSFGFKPLYFSTGPSTRDLDPTGIQNVLHNARTYLTHREVPAREIDAVVGHIRKAIDDEGRGVVFAQGAGKKGGAVSPERYWATALGGISNESERRRVLETVAALNLLHVFGNPDFGLHALNALGLFTEEKAEELSRICNLTQKGALEIVREGIKVGNTPEEARAIMRNERTKAEVSSHLTRFRLVTGALRKKEFAALQERVRQHAETQRWPRLSV